MQRAQPDDGARHAGLRSDPLIRKPRVGGRHQRSIHAPTRQLIAVSLLQREGAAGDRTAGG